MSVLERPTRDRRRAPRRRSSLPRRLAVVAGLGLAFAVGIALGRALDDASDPGRVTTSVRTLSPLPQQPPARTVTVTVTVTTAP